jgi:hypothetical protein
MGAVIGASIAAMSPVTARYRVDNIVVRFLSNDLVKAGISARRCYYNTSGGSVTFFSRVRTGKHLAVTVKLLSCYKITEFTVPKF